MKAPTAESARQTAKGAGPRRRRRKRVQAITDHADQLLDSAEGAETARAASVGRPRLLKKEDILAKAVELGLENLTMKRLANALNVGAATLYQYFDGRDALLRAAAVHALADMPLPKDTGQHWSAYARSYAYAIQRLLADNPSYIRHYRQAAYGFEVQFEMIERFLQVMVKRGFEPGAALQLQRALAMAGMAGAIEVARERGYRARGVTGEALARRQLAQLEEHELPLTRQAMHVFGAPSPIRIELFLEPLLREAAIIRGEDPTGLDPPRDAAWAEQELT